ncbi:MAG: DUF485 domain-containing protein [Gemmatimonadetes bacterium]|nr:DUF485 domain-containing protein [Gemmatimonadota bacterium]
MSSHALHVRRWRIAIALTAGVAVVYFGFILLIAYRKEFMGSLVTNGLSVGILFGALVIVASWVLTWLYVLWANTHFDSELAALSGKSGSVSGGPR